MTSVIESMNVTRGRHCLKISLLCSLCHYQFRSPKILPCYHSFCEACLYGVVAGKSQKDHDGTKTFGCPTCRARTVIPKGGVNTLQSNMVLSAQVIRLNLNTKKPACDVCAVSKKSTQPVVLGEVKCWECNKFLCRTCLKVHRNLLKIHNLISITQAGHYKVLQFSYCGVHPEERLVYYCRTCSETICRDCRATTHFKGHNIVDMADVQASAKELVSKVNEMIVENFIPTMESNVKIFQKEAEEMSKQKPRIVAAIKEREKQLLKLVREAAQGALRSVDEVVGGVEEESRVYQNNLSRMRSEVEFNELVLESGCEADVLRAAKNVIPYSVSNSPQACLVAIVSQKQTLVWDKQATLNLGKDPNMTLADWRHYADGFLGKVSLQTIKLTHSTNQSNDGSRLFRCFRKVGLLVDAYRKYSSTCQLVPCKTD